MNRGNRPPSLMEEVCPGRDELDGRSLPPQRLDSFHSKLYLDRYPDTEQYLRVTTNVKSVLPFQKWKSFGFVSMPIINDKSLKKPLTVPNVYLTNCDVITRFVL